MKLILKAEHSIESPKQEDSVLCGLWMIDCDSSFFTYVSANVTPLDTYVIKPGPFFTKSTFLHVKKTYEAEVCH